MGTSDYKTFNYLENGEVNFSILDTIKTSKTLEPNVYKLGIKTKNFDSFATLHVEDDGYCCENSIDFYFKSTLSKIYDKFFDVKIKNKINLLGYKHKTGILLYGKQGTGKSSIFKSLYEKAVKEEGAIIFIFDGYNEMNTRWAFVQAVRKIQDNPIIIFWDEMDEAFANNQSNVTEGIIKIIMDGSNSIDNCFFMAATNYYENIPKTLTERPSRFKYCIEVEGVQSEDVILKFVSDSFEKVGMEMNIESVKDMKGYTIDQLKEVVVNRIMEIEEDRPQKRTVGFNK